MPSNCLLNCTTARRTLITQLVVARVAGYLHPVRMLSNDPTHMLRVPYNRVLHTDHLNKTLIKRIFWLIFNEVFPLHKFNLVRDHEANSKVSK